MKKVPNKMYGIIEGGQPLAITTDERGWIAIQFSGGYDVVDPDGDGDATFAHRNEWRGYWFVGKEATRAPGGGLGLNCSNVATSPAPSLNRHCLSKL